MGRVFLIVLLAFFLAGETAKPCVITSFSPAGASPGGTVTLTGTGFTGATSVTFTQLGLSKTASFTVISDTEMTVTVPAYNPGARTGGYYITVITNSGLTFTMDPTVTVVQNGGSTGSGGSVTFYIEAGGSATNNGSGGDSYYVKSGGSVGGSGGGGDNVAYVEPGATVTLPGATVVQVAQITPSPVSALFQLLPPLPVPTTGGVTNVATASATVSGTVNPEGYKATAYFEYGTDLTYGSQTAAQTIRPAGNQTTAMSANLTNLQPNTLYHYQLVATNTGGTGYGGDQTFATVSLVGGMPGALDLAASGVTANGGTLNAVVNPNGTTTSVYFQYGLTGTYGSTTTAQTIGNGTADVAVTGTLTGLLPNTVYHYSAVAINTSGTTSGADQTFQTGAVGIYNISPAEAPSGAQLTLNGVGFTGATSVLFTSLRTGSVTAASFAVISDSQMSVTEPSFGNGPLTSYYITVITNLGVTVTLNPTATILENGVSSSSGGGATIYVEPGGLATNNGSGSDTYYVKSGGTVNAGGGGGGNVAYAEAGASVTGITPVIVPVICQSPVPALFQQISPGPVVTTGSASNVEFTDATANGTVNPEGGGPTTVYCQYGTDTTYGSQSGLQTISGLGYMTSAVAVALNNLMPGTTYHYRLAATNSGGTNYGADATFTTGALGAGAPGVLNEPAADVTYNAGILNGVVDPNGLATSVYFMYGVSASYGNVTATQTIGNGTNDVTVQALLMNLLPNTTYHYAIVATNGNATTTSADQTFQTGAVGISEFSPAQAAAGATLTLSGVGFTGATSVLFNQLGTVTSGSFVVVSDTEMTVTVPNCGVRGGSYYITVITGTGVTVTLDPATAILENGSLASSGGGALIYVDSGGAATNNGSGSDTYYVKNGGSVYSTGGGGGNVAYAEPGATVTGVSVIPEANVSESPVPVLFQFLAPGRAVTGPAGNVAINNAMTTGTVNAEGTPATACIQYGPDAGGASSNTGGATALASATTLTSTGSVYVNQTPSESVGSGTSDMPLAVNLNGLTSNTLYDFRVVVTNAAGTTYGTEQQFTTLPGPHDIWNENEFTAAQLENPAISGPAANPAGDGISNLMKYALGMNPTACSTAGLPVSGTAAINGTDCITFTYTKMDSATDITYHPEWSSNLSAWSNTGLTEVVLSDNGTSQQVQDSIPASNSYPIFFHLRVTMP